MTVWLLGQEAKERAPDNELHEGGHHILEASGGKDCLLYPVVAPW